MPPLVCRSCRRELPGWQHFFGHCGAVATACSMALAGIFAVTLGLALFRFELPKMVVFYVASALMLQMPLTFDLAAWWAVPTWLALTSLLLLAAWSFRISLAGRPVFRDRLLQG